MVRLRADVRHVILGLLRRRAASAAAIVVIALGVGLTTAMFVLTDPYLFRPLPYPDSGELVWITVGVRGVTRDATLPTFNDWQARTDLFRGLAAVQGRSIHRLRLSDRGAIAITLTVSPNLLDVLGLPGGGTPEWRTVAAGPTPILVARRAEVFPGDALQVGALLHAQEGPALRVTGLLPERFLFPDRNPRRIVGLTPFEPDGVLRIDSWRDDGRPRRWSSLSMIGRLQPGITDEAVRDALGQALPSGRRLDVLVEPLRDRLSGNASSLALGALSAGLLVLFVCAGNVGNLWMASSMSRSRERATRVALGARRRDLFRLWAVEAVLLSTLSCGLGMFVAGAVVMGIVPVLPEAYAAFGMPALDLRAFAFALAATIAVASFGSVPVILQLGRRPEVSSSLTSRGNVLDRTVRGAFVAFQSALAMVLLVGAAMLGRSYFNLISQDPGFDPEVIAATVMYPQDWNSGTVDRVIDDSVARLRRVPGIGDVAVASGNVVVGSLSTYASTSLTIRNEPREAMLQSVSVGFFDVAGMTIVRGRSLRLADGTSGIVINETLAREGWGAESPIGQYVGPNRTIVGVVKDAFERRYDEQPEPTVYSVRRGLAAGALTYLFRAHGESGDYVAYVRRALFEASPDAIMVDISTLGDKLAFTIRDRTFAALVLFLFGLAAGTVTVGGLIGIVGFIVARRTREIAIRIAIGTQPRQVRSLVVRHTLIAAAVGLVIGLLTGRFASTSLVSLLYGIDAGSWATPLVGAGLMLMIMTGAALVPARRAARLQPVRALRAE